MKGKDNYYVKTKWMLFMQSFLPLFVLLAFKHFHSDYLPMIRKFFSGLFCDGDCTVFVKALWSAEFWSMIVFVISVIWIVITVVYMIIFKKIQTSGFESHGTRIEHIEYHGEAGLNFFTSYLLPLIIGIDCFQDFFVFAGLLILVLIMVWRSNLYYENPALTIWNYRTFSFKTNTGEEGIGITKGGEIDLNRRIKQRKIIDELYFIYNE